MKLLSVTAILAFLFSVSACKKKEPPPPPAPVEVAAPVVEVVTPGMEAENPAEKEGQP